MWRITVTVGPHPQAGEFAEYLMGEIENLTLNERDIDGCEVTWGAVKLDG